MTRVLPGDPTPTQARHRMIRVDHAGEYGAARIYAGQIAALRQGDKDLLRHMAEQEQAHLRAFSAMVAERRVRPTALLPLWHVAGFVLGAVTAAMGEKAAMACTVAIEETIDDHYAAQIDALDDTDRELKDALVRFRADEQEHRDIGLTHGAEQAPAYRMMTAAIRTGCRIAIKLSERI